MSADIDAAVQKARDVIRGRGLFIDDDDPSLALIYLTEISAERLSAAVIEAATAQISKSGAHVVAASETFAGFVSRIEKLVEERIGAARALSELIDALERKTTALQQAALAASSPGSPRSSGRFSVAWIIGVGVSGAFLGFICAAMLFKPLIG